MSTPPEPSGITLSHADFEHLLKLAHGDQPPSTATVAHSSSSSPLLHSPWLIDSGATDHMTSNHLLFTAYSPFTLPLLISLAYGRKVPAVGKGTITLSHDLLLHDVLLVLSFPISLLSVTKLCATSSCRDFLTSTCCLFRDTRSTSPVHLP